MRGAEVQTETPLSCSFGLLHGLGRASLLTGLTTPWCGNNASPKRGRGVSYLRGRSRGVWWPAVSEERSWKS